MAKGKSTFCTWFCTETGMILGTTYYKKINNDKVMKEKKMYNPRLRKRVIAKRKDTKS